MRTLSVPILLALAGCSGGALTEMLIVVDTDLAVPSEIDTITLEAEGPAGWSERASARLDGPDAEGLPVSVGLVHLGGELGPIVVTARAVRDGGTVVERIAVTHFVAGRSVVVRLDLRAVCVGVACGPDLTCVEGACGPVEIDPEALGSLDGGSGRLDACGVAERCNHADDDCDGRLDEGIDLGTDGTNCGACGRSCTAEERCLAGDCVLDCDADLADCNGLSEDGCEASLVEPAHCGACDVVCEGGSPLCGTVLGERGCSDVCAGTMPDRCGGSCVDLRTAPRDCGTCGRVCPSSSRARAVCTAGECGMRCDPGYGDCDGSFASGCETPLDSLSDCGACRADCALPHASVTCFAGSCEIVACAPGWGDCDRLAATGCEVPLNGSTSCGGCGRVCAPPFARPSCAAGTCAVGSCDPGRGDCNGLSVDGCEADLASTSSCGGCGRACVLPHASPRCSGGSCAVASCDAGFADCNGIADDGCERPLTTLLDCGACGRACALPGATESCATGTCTLLACAAPLGTPVGNCNAVTADGCETSLVTATDCGACGAACTGAMPLCSGSGSTPACTSGCVGTEVRCGSSCVDLTTDPLHCGSCPSACVMPHASATCSASTCVVGACDPGWADCGGTGDGCETRTDTLVSCGGCGVTCALANASESCAGGTCAILACSAGFRDCDGIGSNGCERSVTTLSDCGGCGAVCALPNASESCATGTCALVGCASGFADCNGLPADGCETPLRTLTDCGACGARCDLSSATESCVTGACAVVSCNAGFGDCDGLPSTGCERSLTTPGDCGACGVACGPLAAATAACASGSCTIAACNAGFDDCDGATSNGCEASLRSLARCGACGTPCALAFAAESCTTGACLVTSCDAGRADCDGVPGNGCEVALGSDADHCGTCTTSCGAGSCAGGTCNGGTCASGFGDCNLVATDGCERALTTPSDCGACGIPCALSNASESCATGACVLGTCTGGFGDCNTLDADGCEMSLTTVANCGACGAVCDLAHAAETCTGAGVCVLGACATGWGSCDGSATNGCERALTTLTDCGGCGIACGAGPHASSPTCASGSCAVTCMPTHFADCDGASANGCEVDTRSDASSCGGCGLACDVGETCVASVCG